MKCKNLLKVTCLIMLLLSIIIILVGCSTELSSQHDDKTITLNAIEGCNVVVRVEIQDSNDTKIIERTVNIEENNQKTFTIEQLAPEEHFSANAVITELSIQAIITDQVSGFILLAIFIIIPLFLGICAVMLG